MLPHYQYTHYYDEPCEICEEELVSNEPDGHQTCVACNKITCDDCIGTCYICEENVDDDEDDDIPLMCKECMLTCTACGINGSGSFMYHPSCAAKHRKNCNPIGRTKRAYLAAKDEVESLERQLQTAKRKLATTTREYQNARNDATKLKRRHQQHRSHDQTKRQRQQKY